MMRQPPTPSARAFVMPMVLFALVVVGLGVGVAMTRFASETRVIARQVRAYQEHHAGMGLQEAIGAWLRLQTGRAVTELIDPVTGHAMDIELSDGSTVSVYLRDGQATALGDLSALPAAQIDEAGLILRQLAASTRPEEYSRMTRSVGPAAVSVNSAPEPVLRAVAAAISPERGGDFANGLIRARARAGAVTRQDITAAVNDAGLSNEQRLAALRLLATDVELWAIIVELRGGRGVDSGRLLSRYGGLARLRLNTNARRQSAGNATDFGSFLTWKELSTDGADPFLGDLDDR